MAFTTRIVVPVCSAVCLLVFASSIVQASSKSGSSDGAASSTNSFTCNQVRELFEGRIGSPTALLSQPEHETESSVCRRGSAAGEYSCCSLDTELGFETVVTKRVKDSVHRRNSALRKLLNNTLVRYQERLQQLGEEAENRTATFLSRLHKIPWAEHRPVVANLFRGLLALGGATHGHGHGRPDGGGGVGGEVEDVLRDFFVNLFPAVFSYVLSGPEQGSDRHPISPDTHSCLKRYADQIQPFGNQPERLVRRFRRSLGHARAFQQTLATLGDALARSESASLDASCRRALLRLQVCPGCRGVAVGVAATNATQPPGVAAASSSVPVKPCRGLCLNVMRGCLAKTSEISSSWDDLVVAFQNLQVGMLGHHDLQKQIIYLDMNVSEAIMMALTDSKRIYDEVLVKCQDVSRHAPTSASSDPLPLVPEPEVGGRDPSRDPSAEIPQRSSHVLHEFRQEVRSLLKVLEDTKGRFNRLPDSLCQEERLFAQDMLSEGCWNGTGVGRYMEQVPEANFLSQVQRNREVRLNLMEPDLGLLEVKESLTHMRRNLSALLNADLMQGDSPRGLQPSPYKSVDREGSGGGGGGGGGGRRLYHHDVIVDDEDLVAYGSGSGSGSGDGGDDEGDGTSRPIETPITRRPTRPPPSSGAAPTLSAVLLLVGLLLAPLAPRTPLL
ncbi:glypican-5-like [Babylonia areolata]|uniref:glypican-5-like n=1 Tax=Babylonia areolata TaxID=304850 RepID=UPI003FD3E77D